MGNALTTAQPLGMTSMHQLREIYDRTHENIFAFLSMILGNIAVIIANIFLHEVSFPPKLATMSATEIIAAILVVVLTIVNLTGLTVYVTNAFTPETSSRDGRPPMTASSIKSYSTVLVLTLAGLVSTYSLNPDTVIHFVVADLCFLAIIIISSGGLKES